MARSMTLGKDLPSNLVYRFNGTGDILCYYAPANFSFKPPTGVWLRFPDDFGRLIFEQNYEYTREYKSYLSNLKTYGISCTVDDGIDVEYGTYKDWKDANCFGYGCTLCSSWFEKTDKTPLMTSPSTDSGTYWRNGVLYFEYDLSNAMTELNADTIVSGMLNNTYDLRGKGLLAKQFYYVSKYPFFLWGLKSVYYMCGSMSAGIGLLLFQEATPTGADATKWAEYYDKWVRNNIIDGKQILINVKTIGEMIVDCMSCWTAVANRILSASAYQSNISSALWKNYIAYKSANKNGIDNTSYELSPYYYAGDPDFKDKYWDSAWGSGDYGG